MRFVSKNGGLQIGLKSGVMVDFTNMNGVGVLETEDKDVIKELKAHPYYGASNSVISFASGDIPNADDSNIVNGARGYRETQGGKDYKALYKEFDKLKSEIVKVDGTYRADAVKESVAKYESLKLELGL